MKPAKEGRNKKLVTPIEIGLGICFVLICVIRVNLWRAFINAPGAAEAGKASGVIDGEYHFVEDSRGY